MGTLPSSSSLDRILRRPELLQVTGLSRATIYRWIEDGRFPGPVKLGPNSVGWRASDVQAWMESLEPARTCIHHSDGPLSEEEA